jgi:hypothetical protein
MKRKAELLAWLCGDICPICQQPKGKYVWTCKDCYKPRVGCAEERALSRLCDDHMRAAEAFLAMVQGQKPETD